MSGGGSGHEPAHAGFVGKGMLDAAVCGDVFAFPSQIQVYQAIKAIKKGAEAAVKGAKYTEKLVARMGRAGTVGEKSLVHPDAGAFALGVIFTELSRSLR